MPGLVSFDSEYYYIILFRSPLTLIWYGHAASMENKISCDSTRSDSPVQNLTSDAVIEVMALCANGSHQLLHIVRLFFLHGLMLMMCLVQVNIDIPFAFRALPTQAIESTGSQVLEQILKAMLPRFMSQVCECN